jgi:hypothetical protein
VAVVVEAVDDEVVDHAAGEVEHAGVEAAAGGVQTRNVVGQQAAKEGHGVCTGHVHRQHVGDVEHPGGPTHPVVLLHLRAVVQRHVPAAEIGHARAGGEMPVMQGCASRQVNPSRRSGTKKRGGKRTRIAGMRFPPLCPFA